MHASGADAVMAGQRTTRAARNAAQLEDAHRVEVIQGETASDTVVETTRSLRVRAASRTSDA